MRDGTATRERIDRTAMALFVSKGVTETTIRDISLGAEVAEGALYRHYHSKDALIVELFSRHYGVFAERLKAVSSSPRGLRRKLLAMIQECCRVFDADPVLFRFLLLVQHHSLNHLDGGVETPVDVVRSTVVQGMKNGEIPTGDPDLAAALIMGIILQPATFKTYGRLPGPMTMLADRLTDACWRVLRFQSPRNPA